MRNGIVVIGSVFVDIKGYPFTTYHPTGRNAGRIEEYHGGVCRNIVEDIANLELQPTFIGIVDESGVGTDVIEKLKRHKVNTKYMRRCPDGMGKWMVIFDNDGDVAGSISKRPDLLPIKDIIKEQGDEIFATADSIAIELDLERENLKLIYDYADKYNIPVYAAISNMKIAIERRDYLKKTACLICNFEEAGILFMEDFSGKTPEEMMDILAEKVASGNIKKAVVTMGGDGAVYADIEGNRGVVPAMKVDIVDTSGAGDAFFAGVTAGLTYGKNLKDACAIGTRLAASVICTGDNVCPRFLPSEFGLDYPFEEV